MLRPVRPAELVQRLPNPSGLSDHAEDGHRTCLLRAEPGDLVEGVLELLAGLRQPAFEVDAARTKSIGRIVAVGHTRSLPSRPLERSGERTRERFEGFGAIFGTMAHFVPSRSSSEVDCLVVGGGHNGLAAAATLARGGLSVTVLEASTVLGGAARTEYPFPKAPKVGQSTGAYLLGLMPPELLAELDLDLPLLRRDPHYSLPPLDGRALLFGSDRRAVERQLRERFSDADWQADQRLAAELAAFREDVGPTWLEEPCSIEETAERAVRPELREAFVSLCRGSVGAYLERFGFESDLLKAMYAVTDGFTGCHGGWDTPGTGMNFLIHSMCRLPAADGTWMIVRGGMGTVTAALAEAAIRAGAELRVGAEVAEIEVRGGASGGVTLASGEALRAKVIVLACDPFRGATLVKDALPADFQARLDAMRLDGTTLKVNMCLRDLPTFRALPERVGQHQATIHLLPEEDRVLEVLRDGFDAVEAGRLPEFPSIEWYIHSTIDPSLADERGRHSSALFVQWVPYAVEGSSWDAEESRYTEHLLSICDRFAPGTSDLVDDTFVLTPPKVEDYFGIHRGHIHHVDNRFGFADRVPYRWPIEGLYAGSAGCHPGGSVIGAAGRNAAMCVLRDLS